MWLFESAGHVQRASDKLSGTVAQFGMFFAPSKCKLVLQAKMCNAILDELADRTKGHIFKRRLVTTC